MSEYRCGVPPNVLFLPGVRATFWMKPQGTVEDSMTVAGTATTAMP